MDTQSIPSLSADENRIILFVRAVMEENGTVQRREANPVTNVHELVVFLNEKRK
jgi:hypothetical protein